MVFFMVFPACCSAISCVTMKGKLMPAWYRNACTPCALEQSGNQLYLLYVRSKAYGLCLATSDGVVDPGGHAVHG